MNAQQFSFEELKLKGSFLIRPFLAKDDRGIFIKDYSINVFNATGINLNLKEVFYSTSKKGVLRGIHFQTVFEQAKLIRCLSGCVFDVIVDLRPQSPTFGQWMSFYLSSENNYALYIPSGFGHGFLAIKNSLMSYKCSEVFYSEYDDGIRFDDPILNISWPLEKIDQNLTISDKDKNLQSFQSFVGKQKK